MYYNYFKNFKINNPPWNYYFLQNLDKSEYPLYLAKLFKLNTGENLPLKYNFKIKNWIIDKNKCKTFNQKIQWIKLYGVTDLMRNCTDKVLVCDYVKEKIGDEYLKPILQVCNSFDEIDFEKLPNSFVLKCNHGCKWHFIINDKQKYLNNEEFFNDTKNKITGWLEQNFCWWGGFELQYLNIEPKILIDTLMRDNIEIQCQQVQVYCFNGEIKFIIKIHNDQEITFFDNHFQVINDVIGFNEKNISAKADENIKLSFELSQNLSKDFNFVRVDWMLYQNKLYFEELTFTPYSGFHYFKNKENSLKLGNLLNLER